MNKLREMIKRMSRRFLLIPALMGVISVMLGYYTDQSAVILVFALVGAVSAFMLRHDIHESNTFVAAFAVCIIIFMMINGSEGTMIPEFGREYTAEAEVISVERSLSGRSTVCIRTSEFGLLEYTVFDENGGLPIPGSVQKIRCILFAPERPHNPGEYDREAYLRRKGIKYSVRILATEEIKPSSQLMRKMAFVEALMFGLRSRVTDLFGEDNAAAAAIFLGDTSLIDKDTSSIFRRMGCSHLLAVSGTHFSGFLAIPAMTGANKKNGIRYKFVFVLFCLLLGLFTGWSPSVTRAAIMSSCACCMKDPVSGMSLASLIMILADPRSVLSPGFLMSFGSCIGILVLSDRIREKLAGAGLNKSAASALSALFSAQTGMLPFNLMIDMRYGVITIAVQLVASLIAQTACVFFLPSVLLSLILGEPFIYPAKVMIRILQMFLETSTRFYTGIGLSGLASFAVLALVLYIVIPKSGLRDLMRLISLVICAVTIGMMISDVIMPVRAQIMFIDVGQGDSCLILSGGKSVLIDGGTYEAGRDHVAPVLDHLGIDVVDIAVATHLDEDHLGGIRYLMECDRVSETLTPCPKAEMHAVAAGDRIELSEDTVIRMIYPEADMPHDGENEDSLVCLIESSDTEILMTGDIGAETEQLLLEQGIIDDIDILKIAHHGSSYSTCGAFLDVCTPEYAVISVGRHNDYGHPAPDTIKRLEARNIEIYTTAECGAVTIEVRDKGFNIKVYEPTDM